MLCKIGFTFEAEDLNQNFYIKTTTLIMTNYIETKTLILTILRLQH